MKSSRKKKPAKKQVSFVRRKRRAKKYKGKTPHVYDIHFSSGKSIEEIDSEISNLSPLKQLPKFRGIERTKVKLTLISKEKRKKKNSAVTYIYDVFEPFEINLAILDILYEIYLSPKRGQKGYLQKVRAGSVEQIIVDFETSV